MTANYLVSDTTASGWDQCIYGFLAEKERRSGSKRTGCWQPAKWDTFLNEEI